MAAKKASGQGPDLRSLTKEQLISIVSGLAQDDTSKSSIFIPLSVFSNKKLSALELTVRYLKEEAEMSNKDIANILKRTPQNIWLTYRNSVEKQAQSLKIPKTKFFFPITIFNERLSMLESIICYVHDNYSVGFTEIGNMIGRDPRTVWTAFKRAQLKNEKKR